MFPKGWTHSPGYSWGAGEPMRHRYGRHLRIRFPSGEAFKPGDVLQVDLETGVIFKLRRGRSIDMSTSSPRRRR